MRVYVCVWGKEGEGGGGRQSVPKFKDLHKTLANQGSIRPIFRRK